MRCFSVCFGVMLAWHVWCGQPTYACDWRAELLDTTSKEIKAFAIDDTPLTIPLLKPDHGVNVICVLQKEDVEKSEDEVSKVDIKCLYPDKQILHARAVTGLNFATKHIITLPANLSFSSTTQANKAVYALTVDCKQPEGNIAGVVEKVDTPCGERQGSCIVDDSWARSVSSVP